MTLEGAQSRIWCSEFSWQTVPCPWSIDGETALTGSSPGVRDQLSTQTLYMYVTVTVTDGHPRILGRPYVVEMFIKILPVLCANSLLVHITKRSRQIRRMFQRGRRQARQTSKRADRPESHATDCRQRRLHLSYVFQCSEIIPFRGC